MNSGRMRSLVNRFRMNHARISRPIAATEYRSHFVISAPRSGSTWLQRALNAHPDVFCTEHRWFGDFHEVWPDPEGKEAPRQTWDSFVNLLDRHMVLERTGLSPDRFAKELLARLMQATLSFEAEHTGKSVIIDKITPYLGSSDLVLQSIRDYYPDAKLAMLIRDGRDVAVSGVFDWITREPAESPRYRKYVGSDPTPLRRFFDDQVLNTWAQYWVEPWNAINQQSYKYLLIQYESMKHDQAHVLKELCEEFGVNDEDSILERCVISASFKRMSSGRIPGQGVATAKVRKGVVGDWRNYFTKRDGELFHEMAGSLLIQLGYEKDRSWVDSLPEDLPDVATNGVQV